MPPHSPLLHHLHLSGNPAYHHASHLQSLLVARLLAYKKSLSAAPASRSTPPPSPPPPTILTFSPSPIYTTGRRSFSNPSLSASQLSALQQPLEGKVPEFELSPRGGQITFHGPGQLVVYPVVSLSRPASFGKGMGPRAYVCLLEGVTIGVLKGFGVRGVRTGDPGVWFGGLVGDGEGGVGEEEVERKLAAVGVHLRRNVTSFGVGLNVCTDLRWFERIVACGLEGKGVTSMDVVRGEMRPSLGVEEVAKAWVAEFAAQVGAEVEEIGEDQVLALDDGNEQERDSPSQELNETEAQR